MSLVLIRFLSFGIPMIPPDLPSIPGDWTERTFECQGKTIRLTLPGDPDQMLETPETLKANRQNDFMPYWGYLWPAAIEMVDVVPRLPIAPGASVLELGCGVGLVGIATALCGHNVTLSDYAADAVQVAMCNAALNGIGSVPVRRIDWCEPPPEQFDVILACDVLYEQRDHKPLLQFLTAALTAEGVAWIADPGRQHAAKFTAAANNRFRVRFFDRSLAEQPAQPRGLALLQLSQR